MPRYVGLDVHKQFIEVCFIDEAGKQEHGRRHNCRRESGARRRRTEGNYVPILVRAIRMRHVFPMR